MPVISDHQSDHSTSPQSPLLYTLPPTPTPISNPIFLEKPDKPVATIIAVNPVEVLFGYRAQNPDAVTQMKSYLENGYEFLKRNTFRKSYKFSRSVEKSSSTARILKLLDDLLLNIQAALEDDIAKEIIALAPLPKVIIQISLALRNLRAEVRDALILNGLPVPELPIWGATNALDEWWSANDFGIILVWYRHEVELFLSSLASHTPKNNPPEPSTIHETSSDAISSSTTAPDLPPIQESITMGLAEQKRTQRCPRKSFPAPETLSKAPRLLELLSNPRDVQKTSSSDNDDSSDNSPAHVTFHSTATKLPKSLSARSSMSPDNSTPSGYHFYMRIKPESVPEWDGNADTLARWLSKINQLAGKSENIHKELEKVIPCRFTGSAESWYYSISERDRRKLEKSWDTLKEGISAYWMNHDWLSKQKLRASRATFREPGHSQESPSEFVIHKKDLVSLVYDYSDTELIKFITESVPGNWHAIVHTLSMKTFREFQNSVKYYEDTLARTSRPNSNGFQ